MGGGDIYPSDSAVLCLVCCACTCTVASYDEDLHLIGRVISNIGTSALE